MADWAWGSLITSDATFTRLQGGISFDRDGQVPACLNLQDVLSFSIEEIVRDIERHNAFHMGYMVLEYLRTKPPQEIKGQLLG